MSVATEQYHYHPIDPLPLLLPSVPELMSLVAMRRISNVPRSHYSRIINPVSKRVETASGTEPFDNTTDLTLSGTVVESGYVRRAYTDYLAGDMGGTANTDIPLNDTFYGQRWQSPAWGRLGRSGCFYKGAENGTCCGGHHADAPATKYGDWWAGNVTGTGWKCYGRALPNCFALSPSTYYRLSVNSGGATFYYSDGSTATIRQSSTNCPAVTPTKTDNNYYRTRAYVADFGTGTCTATKLTSYITSGDITAAKITPSLESYYGADGGTNTYYVSRDGGTTWFAVTAGVWYTFSGAEATKNQFKWKVDVGQLDRGSTETIGQIGWEIEYEA